MSLAQLRGGEHVYIITVSEENWTEAKCPRARFDSKSAEVCSRRSLWLIVRIISFRQDSHVMSGEHRRQRAAEGKYSCYVFQVSECSKSEGPSLSTSPGSDFLTSPAHRSVPLTARHFSRTSSRASQSSLQSPIKSNGSSPPKTGSSNSLNKFHNRLVDKLKRSLKKADDCADDQRNLSWDNPRVLSRHPITGSKPIEIRRISAPTSVSGTSSVKIARSCPEPPAW